jgi:lipid II:glycine glycyltransferase (peptidoglycan interpeptide bridge formation enzyme)
MTYSRGRYTVLVDQFTESEWNSLLQGFADASIYQTWAYGAVCWGERQLSHLVLRRDGEPVALAQLRVVRVPVLGSGIAYLRCGPMCTTRSTPWDADVCRAITEALVQEYVVRRRLVLRVLPNTFMQDTVAGAVENIFSELGLLKDASVRKYHTLRVDLRPTVEELRRRLSSRWRRQLNISERNSLEIVEGQTDDLYQQFLGLYREMFARKQFDTSVDVDEFRRIQQRLPTSSKMMTLICLGGGLPVAGLVVSTVGRTAIYLLAATGDDGLNLRGSYLLQWHAIQRLKELGREWYDLGGVNQEVNPGVFTFKSGMGGEEVYQLGHYQVGDALSKLSVSVGEGARRILQKVVAVRGQVEGRGAIRRA